VAAVESEDGRFPQVSGMRFVYAISAPPGKRVKSVEVGGQPLDPAREYVVATNDFLVAGGDGYKTFARVLESADAKVMGGAIVSSRLAYNDPGTYLRDVLADLLRAAGTVAPKVEGRITQEK
jgi:5'-nucleotidase / UDP-sugar diphosphatase